VAQAVKYLPSKHEVLSSSQKKKDDIRTQMGTKGRSQRHREEANQGKRPQKNSSLSTP
jgi:hypothetical protein